MRMRQKNKKKKPQCTSCGVVCFQLAWPRLQSCILASVDEKKLAILNQSAAFMVLVNHPRIRVPKKSTSCHEEIDNDDAASAGSVLCIILCKSH